MNSSNSNSANTDIEFNLSSNNMQQQVKQPRSATSTSADICDDDLSLYGMYVNEPSTQHQQPHHSNHQQQQHQQLQQQQNEQATITVIRGGGSNSNNNQNIKMQYLVRNESAIIMANSANNQQYQQHQQQQLDQQLDHQHQQKQQQQQRTQQLQNILQYNKVYKSTIIVPNATTSATLTRIPSANKTDCDVDIRCNNEQQLSDDEQEIDLSNALTLNGKPTSPIHHHHHQQQQQHQSHNRRARRLQTRSPTLTSVYIEEFNCRTNRMTPITVIQAGALESTNNKNKHYHNSMSELDNGEASNEYITAEDHHYQYQTSQSDATLSEHTTVNNNRHRSRHMIEQHHHRQVVTIIDEDNIVDDDVDDNDYSSSGNLSNFILKNSANEILIGCNNNVIDDDDDDIAGGGSGDRRTVSGHHSNEIEIGDIDDDDVVHHHHHHDELLVKDHSSNHLGSHNDCVEYLNDDLEDLKVMIVC